MTDDQTMKSQLRHVFKTYFTRPLVWVLGTGVLLLMVALFFQSVGRSGGRSWIAPDLHSMGRWKSLSNQEPSPRDDAADSSRVGTLDLRVAPGLPLPDLQAYSRVRLVRLRGDRISFAQVEQLKTLPHLRSLQIRASDFPPGALVLLAEKLEELEVDAELLTRCADDLPALVHLRLLRTGGVSFNARTIARLPHLRQLVIGPVTAVKNPFSSESESQDAWGRLDMEKAAFQPLIPHSQLREVYADWCPRLEQDRPFLAAVHGYPLYSSHLQSSAVPISFFVMVLLIILLAVQLGAQFQTPAAIVVPGYAAPHQWVAGIVLGTVSTLCVAGMMMTGASLLPALAIVMFVPAYTAVVAELIVLGQDLPGARQSIGLAVGAIVIAPWFFLQLTHQFFPWAQGVEVWFLNGHYPVQAGLILLVNVGVLGFAFSRFPTMARRKLPVIGWGFETPYSLAPGGGNPHLEASKWQNWMEPRLADLTYHAGSFRQQVSLFRKGNPYRPLLFPISYLMGAILFGGLFNFLRSDLLSADLSPFLASFAMIGAILGQMPVILIIMPAIFWFRRRSSFEMEFCRPADRRGFARQLFCGLAADQSPALIPMALLVVIFAILIPSIRGIGAVGAVTFCATGAWLACYAATCASFVFKRNWPVHLSFLTGFILCIFCSGLIGGALVTGRTDPDVSRWFEYSSTKLIALALGINLLLIGLISAMYRKCCEREWG